MKISELLNEATTRPLELRDIVKFFPNTYRKVLRAKLSTDQVTYHGLQLQHEDGEGDMEFGPAYDKALAAAEYAIEQNGGVTVDVEMSVMNDDGDTSHHHYSFETPIDEKSEVYVGYSPENDALYLGFDCWISENEFNESWEREFEEATGEQFDSDNPQHEAAFQKVWNHFKDRMMYGMLFEVTAHNGHWEANEMYCIPGTFYQGIYKFPGFQRLELIDLRTK